MALIDRLISTIAPHECVQCGREGSLLCAWCLPDACPALPSRCYRCQRLSSFSRVCEKCRTKTKLSHVWVRTEYEGVGKELVRLLKFERNQAAAERISLLMSEGLPYLSENTFIVHVPTTTVHVRQRGYDQAKLIASKLSVLLSRRHLALLARTGQTHQVGSRRIERVTQLEGAFHPLRKHLIKGAHIVLVDDVITTGATIEEAARTLRKAGAKRVDAVVFARAV